MKPAVLVVGLSVLGLLASCGRGGPDCSAAANNVVVLIRAELTAEAAKTDAKELRNKEAMLPSLKEELVKHCKTQRWSESVRKCIAAAKTADALEPCDPDADLFGTAAKASE